MYKYGPETLACLHKQTTVPYTCILSSDTLYCIYTYYSSILFIIVPILLCLTVFWHVVRETLGKHEAERYMVLKHITNDTGRGRAWLRSCLNEKSLERQLNGLKSNAKLIG